MHKVFVKFGTLPSRGAARSVTAMRWARPEDDGANKQLHERYTRNKCKDETSEKLRSTGSYTRNEYGRPRPDLRLKPMLRNFSLRLRLVDTLCPRRIPLPFVSTDHAVDHFPNIDSDVSSVLDCELSIDLMIPKGRKNKFITLTPKNTCAADELFCYETDSLTYLISIQVLITSLLKARRPSAHERDLYLRSQPLQS
ncbi:hypothetical protein EVAR_45296_1 [Eumeta japonica]|uniref:Uncharacterized protein n=1 Tax=Eumeta variegata TaxID=151549 RepID=A0A4C1Y6W3_EUMVA|nr:hypothetical protein EVAR_45296_1 [Eumeta japonica]